MTFHQNASAALLALVIIILHPIETARANPLEDSTSGVDRSKTSTEAQIARVTDPMLRDALEEMFRHTLAHTPPTVGIGNSEEVLKICRSSQRVYCNFLGVQATSTISTVKMNKQVIKEIYEIVFDRLKWITARESKQSDLFKCLESIREKYHLMGLEGLAKTTPGSQSNLVSR